VNSSRDQAVDSAPVVLTERRDGVLVITLNRPQARNAVNLELAEALAAAIDELDGDSELRLGVLTGAGSAFCAGMDLKAFSAGQRSWVPGRGFAGITERASRKPLIAAVEGFALAGGLEVALACDLIVAARDAQLGIPEVRRGLTAAAGGLLRLPQRLPPSVAAELAFTGEPIDAVRAHALGLVNRLAEPGDALDVALELAATIAANGPLAVLASKRVLDERPGWAEAEAWERQREIVEPIFTSQDAAEGARAFTEKRAPEWRGE
jgi:enoyl-CoA hydratase